MLYLTPAMYPGSNVAFPNLIVEDAASTDWVSAKTNNADITKAAIILLNLTIVFFINSSPFEFVAIL